MKSRALANVISGIEKGENSFILYGEFIQDQFLENIYGGPQDIKEVVRSYFMDEVNYDYFVFCAPHKFEVYTPKSGKKTTDELTKGTVAEDDDLGGMDPKNAKRTQKQQEESQEAGSKASGKALPPERNSFEKVVERIRSTPKKKFVILFENFEWTVALFKSSNDDELGYIEKLLELRKYNNCISIVTITDAELLKKYGIDTKSKTVEMLGAPSVEEIYRAYIRKYLKKYRGNRTITVDQMSELYEIATAVGSSDKSLKESMRIFDHVMEHNGGNIQKKDFENAIDKAIEEKVLLDDVVLSKDKKDDIVGRVEKFLKSDSQKIAENSKGLILTGPPGTGKTYLVKAIANEKNCYFLSPTLGDLKGEYVGHTSANVKRFFQQARANSPTIVFIDEADSFFPSRGGNNTDSYAEDMVNQFLVEMDGLSTGTSKVFVIAATNRIDLLDSAIKSRLGSVPVEIPLPGKSERKELFRKLLAKKGVEKFVDYSYFNEDFLDRTDKFSGRDIKNFVSNMETEAESQAKKLTDFTDADSVRGLFSKALDKFESDIISRLSNTFHIQVKRPTEINDGYDSIIGCDNVKRSMQRQIRFFDVGELKRAEKYGVVPKRGILLYGPPGNAKSQIAEATAKESDLLLMKITNDMFSRNSPADQSKAIVEIFNGAVQLSQLCTKQKGVLLFFDEFDTLGGQNNLDIRATMLKQLDNAETMRSKFTKVLFVAATNFIDNIDEAMKRPGRIDEKIRMSNPTQDEGVKILLQLCNNTQNVEPISESLAKQAYDKLLKAKQDSALSSIEKFKQLLNKKDLEPDSDRPSGADIKHYVQSLVEYAYDNNVFAENQDKLQITDSVVDLSSIEFL